MLVPELRQVFTVTGTDFTAEMVAIARAQPAPFVQNRDALIAAKYWDQLEAGALVLDLGTIQRAPTLFGRTTGSAHMNVYIRLPKFEQLMANPDPKQFADAGYDYLYLGKRSWQNLTEEQTKTFQHPCVIFVEEQRTEMNDFRRLLDIQQCRGIR